MKKIVAIITFVCCLFLLCSCNQESINKNQSQATISNKKNSIFTSSSTEQKKSVQNSISSTSSIINNPLSNSLSKSSTSTSINSSNKVSNNSSIQSSTKPTDVLPIDKFNIVESKTLYVSPTGSGTGTKTDPAPILASIGKLGSGTYNTVVLEKGTYITKRINLSQSGTSDERLRIICPDGMAKFDFKGVEKSVNVWGNYWHLYGIMAYDSSDKGFHISGNGNIIERCVACFSRNTGIRIGGSESGTIDDWPSNNLILNCTSFASCDAKGQNADGFSCNLNAGVGNVFDGCIAYENCDDGWDLFSKRTFGPIGSVVIKNCIAFKNGWIIDKNGVQSERIGDGNGFKLGGSAIEVNHTVTNCIAYDNFANGFDDNSNPGTLTLSHCTSYNNGMRNIAMGRFRTENSIYDKVWEEYGVSFGPINGIAKSHNIFNNVLSFTDQNVFTTSSYISDAYVGSASQSYFSTSYNKDVRFIEQNQSVNSHLTTSGVEMTFTQIPFVSITTPYTNLLEVDEKLRDADGNIKLNDFLSTTTAYNNFGANL